MIRIWLCLPFVCDVKSRYNHNIYILFTDPRCRNILNTGVYFTKWWTILHPCLWSTEPFDDASLIPIHDAYTSDQWTSFPLKCVLLSTVLFKKFLWTNMKSILKKLCMWNLYVGGECPHDLWQQAVQCCDSAVSFHPSDHQVSSCFWDPCSFHREERQSSWESLWHHRECGSSGTCPDLPASPLSITFETQR